uniref:rRNA maturation RNase YbeY n=1 Tax=Flavobacterium sp. TaxID=239 RepID=UPI0040493182
MIDFSYLHDFILENEEVYTDWIVSVIDEYDVVVGELNYIFCSDEYLHKMNVDFLEHDTFTDIITFDYSEADVISGDLFISIDRVKENAASFNCSFQDEILRVMSHGVFHLLGFKDKTESEISEIRALENQAISLFHVKQ